MLGLSSGLVEGVQKEMDAFKTELAAIRKLLETLVKQGEQK